VQFLIKSGIQQTQESGGRSLASSNSKDSIWQAAKCCKVAAMRRLFACLSFCATRMGHSTGCISVLSDIYEHNLESAAKAVRTTKKINRRMNPEAAICVRLLAN